MLILSRKELFRTYQEFVDKQKQHARWAASFIALIVMIVSFALPTITRADANTVVSISVDGDKKVVSTDASTVAEVLERADVPVGTDDLVEPGLGTAFNNAIFNINVYRAKSILVVDGDKEIKVHSAYQSPKLIAERSAGLKVYPEDLYRTELIQNIVDEDSIGERITIIRATPFTIKVDGKVIEAHSQAKTVAAALKDKGIVLGKEDQLNVDKNTQLASGMTIEVKRIGHQVVATEEPIAFQAEIVYDNNQDVGWEQTRQAGANGRQLVTYEVRHENGQIVEKKPLQTVVLVGAQNQITVRGSRPKYSPLADAFARLRQCESGGNYAANTGNGYYGAYQFSSSTWRSMGTGYDLAHQAPPAVQDNAAIALQARAGWGQWPSCARKLNLY